MLSPGFGPMDLGPRAEVQKAKMKPLNISQNISYVSDGSWQSTTFDTIEKESTSLMYVSGTRRHMLLFHKCQSYAVRGNTNQISLRGGRRVLVSQQQLTAIQLLMERFDGQKTLITISTKTYLNNSIYRQTTLLIQLF